MSNKRSSSRNSQYICLPPYPLKTTGIIYTSSHVANYAKISLTWLLMILVVEDVKNENWNDAQLVSFSICSHTIQDGV